MQWSRVITIVDTHCAGEVGRVLTGGVIDIPGRTMEEKLAHLNDTDDSLRRFVVQEPRGGVEKTVNLIVPPTREEAHAGFIPMEADGCYPMSGSNAMCVATVLLETGMVPMQEPETRVVLDTAAGLVPILARCENGRCVSCTVDTTNSFAIELDAVLEIEGHGTLSVDFGWGGWFYAFVDAAAVGFAITPDEAADIAAFLRKVGAAVREQAVVKHPYDEAANRIPLGVFPFLALSPEDGSNVHRHANLMPGGRVDRSPCGTGSSARLGVLHARGRIKVGEELLIQSITGGEFRVAIRDQQVVQGIDTVLPRITGRAFIYGISQLGVDPEDPFPTGFCLSDLWGKEIVAGVSKPTD